jgi:hypothetical protein
MADSALDAWALGVVAFELLTKTQAFQMIVQDNDEVCVPPIGTMGTHARVHAFVLHLITPPHAVFSLDIIIVTLPCTTTRGGLCRW